MCVCGVEWSERALRSLQAGAHGCCWAEAVVVGQDVAVGQGSLYRKRGVKELASYTRQQAEQAGARNDPLPLIDVYSRHDIHHAS